MSNFEKVFLHELHGRRIARAQLAWLVVAVGVVLGALITAL
jgi:hypothetical protein